MFETKLRGLQEKVFFEIQACMSNHEPEVKENESQISENMRCCILALAIPTKNNLILLPLPQVLISRFCGMQRREVDAKLKLEEMQSRTFKTKISIMF